MKVKDICEINEASLNKNINFDSYLYLDTSNLFEGSIYNLEVFESKDDLPSRAKRIVNDKDILFSTIRPNQNHYGIMDCPPKNLLVSTGFAVITPNKDLVNPHYLYYFLTKEKNVNHLQMIAETGVSSYPSIKPEDIGNLNINLPPLEQQNKIAKNLLLLDEKIRINSSLISNLEEYGQLLFHKWFIDYNFPKENGNPYKDSNGEMQEVDGSFIPIGWSKEVLKSFIVDISNGDWGQEEPFEGAKETYCIRGADIPNIKKGSIQDVPLRYIKETKVLKHGNIVIEASGGSPTQSTGRTVTIRDSLLNNTGKPIYFSNFSKMIVPRENYSMFLYLLLNNLYEKDVFFHFEGKTSGIRNLLLNNLINKLQFVNPSSDILAKFEEQIGLIWDKIITLGQENELLDQKRNLLTRNLIK